MTDNKRVAILFPRKKNLKKEQSLPKQKNINYYDTFFLSTFFIFYYLDCEVVNYYTRDENS